jgi:adenosine kinase
MQIFVYGSLAYDRIMDFPERFSDHILPDKIHILNVCFLVNGLKEQFGGTAGNIAYNLSLLGERPLIVACVGKDFENYEQWLTGLGLSMDGIRRIADEFTAGAYITTDIADNQITGFNPGAMKHQSVYDFDGSNPEETLAIIAPGNVDDMVRFSRQCKERTIPYICDPGQQITALSADRLAEMVTGSTIFISNDYELELVMRATGFDKSELLQRTEAVITTLGERGALLSTREGDEHIQAARPSRVADPTGAGDAFRAGLIKGLVTGKSLADAARMGAVVASFGVECQGTQCHRFSQEEFWERHRMNFI